MSAQAGDALVKAGDRLVDALGDVCIVGERGRRLKLDAYRKEGMDHIEVQVPCGLIPRIPFARRVGPGPCGPRNIHT